MDFDMKAVNWDSNERVNRAKIVAEEIEKSIKINAESNAFEFGCGTGLVSFNLKDKFKHITLVDTSIGMIDMVNTKIYKSNVTNMIAIQANIDNDMTMLKRYDVIYTSMVLHHILDVENTLKSLSTLLEVNGDLCIVDLVKEDGSFHKSEIDFNGHNGFKQEELKVLLEKIGLKDIESHVFFHGEKIIGDERIKYSLFLIKGKKY